MGIERVVCTRVRRDLFITAVALGMVLAASSVVPVAAAEPGPGELRLPLLGDARVNDYFTDQTYDPKVPTPDSVLGFSLGTRPVRYDEAIRYLRALAGSSPRAVLVEMGRTYEGRPLHYFVVGSEKNVRDREKIRSDIAALASPAPAGRINNLDAVVNGSPAIAWLGYSIHGDELSGVDASLWVAYHLLAATDDVTRKICDNVLVLIDPSENPDGRERYLAQIFAFNGRVPSRDAQGLQHDGFWPWGRANHYLFDMNRDWLPAALQETRARQSALLHWNPQVIVDAHEMGAFSSYLFSPGREPINLNVTPTIRKWWDVFAADQGAAFDRRGWSYYTGDWNEEWYPGYASTWSLFTGAVGILYEQAGVSGSGVKRPDGTTLTFAQAVGQQAVSSLTNLATTAGHRRELLADYAAFHRDAVIGADRTLTGAYVLAPSGNTGRELEFIATLQRQGLRIERAQAPFSATAISAYGESGEHKFATGVYVIPLNQPNGRLAHALLEFDPHLKPAFLQEERRELEKGKGTRLYEVSGWSLAQAYDLDVSYVATHPGVPIEAVDSESAGGSGKLRNPDAGYGFLLPTADDRSMVALAHMLDAGLSVRAAVKPFVHDSVSYPAGTLLLRRSENPADLSRRLGEMAAAAGIDILGVNSNFSSAGPHLGSDYFALLRQPRIGLFMGTGIDFTSCGGDWFLLDTRLGIRHTLLDITQLSRYDLSAYNVLLLPSYWGGSHGLRTELGAGGIEKLKTWVNAGGTLIAVGDAAYFCTDSATGLSAARERGVVLDKLAEYDSACAEERAAFTATVDTNDIWKSVTPSALKKGEKPGEKPDLDELRRREARARTFSPQGAIVRLELNPEHWLAFGAGGRVSAITMSPNVLLAKDPVEVPVRMAETSRLRLSGLLWPEARERLAKSAYLTRESVGRGQVILFADEPFFRAYFHGTKRLLENALLLGPGLGTEQPSPW